jgi:hypothetical protein
MSSITYTLFHQLNLLIYGIERIEGYDEIRGIRHE